MASRIRLALTAALLVAGASTAAAAPRAGTGYATGARARQCGLVQSGSEKFQAIETRGSVPCRKVRRVVAAFLNHQRSVAGWHCFDNNALSGQPFAASCARGSSAVVRIYAPT